MNEYQIKMNLKNKIIIRIENIYTACEKVIGHFITIHMTVPEQGGVVNDPSYVYKLFLSLGNKSFRVNESWMIFSLNSAIQKKIDIMWKSKTGRMIKTREEEE